VVFISVKVQPMMMRISGTAAILATEGITLRTIKKGTAETASSGKEEADFHCAFNWQA
jgi:hypothetical protein